MGHIFQADYFWKSVAVLGLAGLRYEDAHRTAIDNPQTTKAPLRRGGEGSNAGASNSTIDSDA